MLGAINSKLNFQGRQKFELSTKQIFLEEASVIMSKSAVQLDHWRSITLEIFEQIKSQDIDFFRNIWVRNALHPNQYYYSYLYYKELKKKYSPSELQHLALDVPFGNPLKDLMVKGASPASVKHFYLLDKISHQFQISLSNLDQIIEFGGGYGSMCRIALSNLSISQGVRWDIVDLPIMVVLQKMYLTNSLTTEEFSRVELHNDLNGIEDISANSLFVATWSLSETPLELRASIEDQIKKCRYVFIAFQETYGPISNLTYFQNLMESCVDHAGSLDTCSIYPGHYYLILEKI